MKTREQKLFDLIKQELLFLIDSPEYLDEVTKFFSDGAYHTMTEKELDKCYQSKFKLEK